MALLYTRDCGVTCSASHWRWDGDGFDSRHKNCTYSAIINCMSTENALAQNRRNSFSFTVRTSRKALDQLNGMMLGC